ncbi:MAG TPA: Phenylacetic acid catabolic protein [Polyangia bacterium]|jgi:1,2-phenylacetyl-CoA epoxidase catalytic subunit|nr:Phenylacetic acid catabolic protein [Polyangia bacterium]
MSAADADPRFRATVDRLLQGQAYRELGAARLFEHGAALAPDAHQRARFAAHANEERAHHRAVIDVWARFAAAPAAVVEARAEDRLARLPLPPARSWFALAMAQFLFDRAGLWQLREYAACSFAPYRALVADILADERDHQDSGAEAIVALCAAGHHESEKDAVFTRWLAVALRSFGRPGSDGDGYAVTVGLKRRSAAAVMGDFVADILPTVRRAGLVFPAPHTLNVILPVEFGAALF